MYDRAVESSPRDRLSDERWRRLQTLVRESGLAALIATHNFALAAEMDRTITIEDGMIVEGKGG